jgi:uncharacterized protein with von Willebrand factor type A (vWA) domain
MQCWAQSSIWGCSFSVRRAAACCFIPAEQVQELELSVDLRSLDKLLDFLSCSFMGGTDVDRPLELSLERLQKDEWQQVLPLVGMDREGREVAQALCIT